MAGLCAIATLLLAITFIPGLSTSVIETLTAISGLIIGLLFFGGIAFWIVFCLYSWFRVIKNRRSHR
ncbi:MAG: hypothetical protein AB8B99_13795 [Phormidesmis sp.]